ncbi:MAG: SPOR domain-containing protein [Pseudomonadota bacterium]|nr:MAG: SPOR domain-containing protein [Pseudomonadota bacterium]
MNTHDSMLPEPSYLDRYGLKEAPFAATLDERFLCPHAQHIRRMDTLQQLAEQRDLLLLVTGEQGVGKTSLLQRFVASAREARHVCQVDADPMMNAERLLQQIAAGFGLAAMPGEAGKLLQGALYQHLLALHHEGAKLLLVVDDAHTLPGDALETLYLLADTEAGDGKLLRLILFCDPHIDTVLQAPALLVLRDRITHTLNIAPLTEEQTAEYLRHRMTVAGLSGPQPFSDKVIRRIFRGSHGVPARINELAHAVLSEGGELREQQAAPQPAPRSPTPRWRVTVVVVAAVIAAIVLVMQQRGDDALTDTPSQEFAVPAIELAPEPPLPSVAEAPQDTAPHLENALAQPVSDEKVETPAVASPAAKAITDEKPAGEATPVDTAASNAALAADTADDVATEPKQQVVAAPVAADPPPTLPAAPRLIAVSPATLAGGAEARTFTLSGENFSAASRITVSWSGNEKILPADRVEFVNAEQLRFRITTGTTADNWQVQVTDPERGASNHISFAVTAAPQPAVAQLARARPAPVIRRDEWYQVQPADRYTLQLFSSHQEQAALRFIAERAPQGEVGYVHTMREGRHWYSVLYGSYADAEAARQGAQAVTAERPEIRPWVRRLGNIQAAIDLAQRTEDAPPPTLPGSAAIATPPAGRQSHTSWLWSQAPGHYTLQLLGTRTEAGIRAFIDNHALKGKAVYYSTVKNSDPWYVLVYGVYPDRAAAEAARLSLPPDLRQAQPWPRDFAGIHADLDRAAGR